MARILVTAALLVAFAFGVSNAQTIAVFADSMGQSDCIEVPQIPLFDLYILFVPGGAAPEMQGAQFRLTGFPPDWIVFSATPNAAASFSLVDPFGPNEFTHACAIAFSECQEGVVMLWKASVLAWPPVEDHVMRIEPVPFCPGTPCWGPIVNLCDAPVYTGIVISSSTSVVNPTGGCTVPVDLKSWAAVKQLFRPEP